MRDHAVPCAGCGMTRNSRTNKLEPKTMTFHDSGRCPAHRRGRRRAAGTPDLIETSALPAIPVGRHRIKEQAS